MVTVAVVAAEGLAGVAGRCRALQACGRAGGRAGGRACVRAGGRAGGRHYGGTLLYTGGTTGADGWHLLVAGDA